MISSGFSQSLQKSVDEIVSHYNDQHSDTIVFIAKHLLRHQEAVDAEIELVTPDTITFNIRTTEGNWKHGRSLDVTINHREQVAENFLGLLRDARARAGQDAPKTSIEKELAYTASLRTYTGTVKASRWITSTIREITFEGLKHFESPGWDAFMFVMVPPEGESLRTGFDMKTWRSTNPEERSGGAYYTIRQEREGEIDLWFVIHETYGAVSNWAAHAQTGDKVALWGPRIGFKPPTGTRTFLLMGDETAYPAIAAIMDNLPADARVTVILEYDREKIDLRQERDWQVIWEQRRCEPGADRAIMRALSGIGPTLKTDGLFVFGAAEADQMSNARKWLRQREVPREQIHLTGYWRRN